MHATQRTTKSDERGGGRSGRSGTNEEEGDRERATERERE